MDSYETYEEFIDAHATGTAGDAYLVGGELYVWDGATGMWKNMGSLIGPTGAAGATILDSYETYEEFIGAHATGTAGDAYLVGGELYVWDEATDTWKNMGSLIGPAGPQGSVGPTGPQGNDGADGIIGRIEGIVATVDDLPTEGVEQGTIFYVEEDNGVYVWDAASDWTKIDVAQGPRGATGETGPSGADGVIGQIDGVVETVADLPTTGVEQGTIYYVEEDGNVYVWDATGNWVNLGMIQGPRGPAGPEGPQGPAGTQGNDGADGIIGRIEGVVATVNDLPTEGVEQGTIFYVEEDGGVYVWDAASDWTKIEVAQGPRGATGETGPSGADGVIGQIDGVVETVDDLPTTGVEQGTIYFVEEDGNVYVWDATGNWINLGMIQGPRGPEGSEGPEGPQGPTGEQGPTGPAASSAAIIPFASQQAPLVGTNIAGEPVNVALVGFGYMEYSGFGAADDANVAISIEANDKSFSLSADANRQLAFSVPFDMTINSLYITVGNWSTFPLPPTGTLVYPYVQLYAAPAASNTFFPIDGAVAKPEQGIDPASAAAATMRAGSVDGLSINLRAGTRIAICGMMEITGDNLARNYYLYYTGGIGMTYSPAT